MKLFIILVFAFIAGLTHATDPVKEDVAEILSKGTNVEPIKVDTPVYPHRALRSGIEGWVVLKFVVKADGTTDEIEVFESSIEDYFDDAAIEATKKRIYKPATLQGKPVMQGNLYLRTIFQISNSDGGVSKPFLKLYRGASKALDDGNLELANKLIEKLDGKEKRLLAEVCYLDMLKARYFEKMGNDKATLRHVERALVIADDVAEKRIYISLLRQAIVDNGKTNNFQASLKHYETLIEVDNKMAPDDPIHSYVTRINQVLDGNGDINIKGDIPLSCKKCEGISGSWQHVLNRNRFLIDLVAGELSEIGVVCQNSSVTVVYREQMAWSVNRDAGVRSISVSGEKGTTFRLVELPNES
jgi:TonB family protein